MTATIDIPICSPKRLEPDMLVEAALNAINENPTNRPLLERMASVMPRFVPTADHLAVLTTKYWGSGGVKLTVGFLEPVSTELQQRILSHANAWSTYGNVQFTLANVQESDVRISLAGNGYWSYLGTDIKMIPRNQPTMNLQGFTMATSESEFIRVVRHEFGHTLGFPHEHMRQQLVALLDSEKTVRYFARTQGWNRQMVIQQVLTPISEGSLLGASSATADSSSIMCYQLPGQITRNGQPIAGGDDIDTIDREVIGKSYPLLVQPPPPPPPSSDGKIALLVGYDSNGKELGRWKAG